MCAARSARRRAAREGLDRRPDATKRARSRSQIVAVASDAAGTPLATVRLEGDNPYDFTGAMLAWGAMTAASGGLRGSGALGPVDAFGLDELRGGRRARPAWRAAPEAARAGAPGGVGVVATASLKGV